MIYHIVSMLSYCCYIFAAFHTPFRLILRPKVTVKSIWSAKMKAILMLLFLLGGVRIHKTNLHRNLSSDNANLYWESVSDWILQLIGRL